MVSAVTELTGVGKKTGETLRKEHGIETVRELAVAFFGWEGEEIVDVLYQVKPLIGPLRRAARSLVVREDFGVEVDVSAAMVVDTMAFIRLFGVRVNGLTDEYRSSMDVPTKYAVTPSDVDWDTGAVTNPDNTMGFVYGEMPWEYLVREEYQPVSLIDAARDALNDGVIEVRYGECTTHVEKSVIEDIGLLTDVEHLAGCVGMYTHPTTEDFPVLVQSDDGGVFVVAPKIQD